MNRKLVIMCFYMIFMLILPAFSFGGADQERPNAVAVESSYEFSPVLDGAQIVHDFIILNKGGAVLEIEKVETW